MKIFIFYFNLVWNIDTLFTDKTFLYGIGIFTAQAFSIQMKIKEVHIRELAIYTSRGPDKLTFSKYVTADEEIKVRKTAYNSGSFDYRGYMQNPNEEWIQESNAGAYTNRTTVAALPFAEFLPESGRITQVNIKFALAEYISRNTKNIEFNFELESANFLGLKLIVNAIESLNNVI